MRKYAQEIRDKPYALNAEKSLGQQDFIYFIYLQVFPATTITVNQQ